MQFTTLSVALFAALATAHAHNPQHFHHRRQYNGTSSAAGVPTTMIVYATNIITKTECPASVTDCPARTSPVVVTEVVPITTTVCPVEQAESVSSAALSQHSATQSADGVATKPAAPLGTGNSGPAPTGTGESSGEDTTLTYTLGTGTSTTVVTTTIKHTSTATVYATIPYSGGAGEDAGVTAKEGVVSVEPTTTFTSTSTSTRYITVQEVSSAAGAGSGAPGAGGDSGNCVPITVTVAAMTVTVTETATPTPDIAANGVQTADGAASSLPVPANNAGGSAGDDNPNVIVSTATVVPLPVQTPAPVVGGGAPYGNGTNSADGATKSYHASSGFISKTKPAAIPTAY